jgi:hypothetical protein
MSESVSTDFWKRWYEADELTRVKLVMELTVVGKNKKAIHKGYEHGIATLLNSYFEDLAEYLKSKE